jgi:hypothetical protein
MIKSNKQACAKLAELTGIDGFRCAHVMKAMLVESLLLSAKQDAQSPLQPNAANLHRVGVRTGKSLRAALT